MNLPQSYKRAPVPVVYKEGPRYTGLLADINKPISAGQVLQAVAFQKQLDVYTGQNFEDLVTVQPVQASDIAANGTKVFDAIQGTSFPEDVVGSGRLEAVKIVGVAYTDCPINYGDRWTGTQDMTQYQYDTAFGGMETRAVTYITEGQCWIKYESTAAAPTIGQGVTLSAAEDGAVVATSDRVANICVGLVRGFYDDGTNKFVLVQLTPDRW